MSNPPAGFPAFVTGSGPAGGKSPPPEQDLHMRIGADGVWYYRNSPIERPALVKLFASILSRAEDGSYWLVTPAERGRIEVEDAPFLATTLSVEGAGEAQRLRFGTNIEAEILAGPDHPIRLAIDPSTGEPRPYVLLRPGLEARIVRPVFYQLADLAVARLRDGREELGVYSAGAFFPLDGPWERRADE